MVRTTVFWHNKANGVTFGLFFSGQHLVSLNQFQDSQTKEKCICEQGPYGEAKNPSLCCNMLLHHLWEEGCLVDSHSQFACDISRRECLEHMHCGRHLPSGAAGLCLGQQCL